MNGIEFICKQMEGVERPPADRNAWIVTLSQTLSQRDIARKIGVSRATVYNVMRTRRQNKEQA